MGCAYKLTSPSGKAYIGVTRTSIDTRWKGHLKDSKRAKNYAIYNAIRKYGAEAFIKEILDESDDLNYLLRREAELIVEHKTLSPDGYNLTSGGRGTLNPSPETRERMSQAAKARFAKKEERLKAAERTTKTYKEMTPEESQKYFAIRKEAANIPEVKEKMRQRLAEQRKSTEFVQKHKDATSKKNKELWADPEYRAMMLKMRNNVSEETKRKRSEGQKRAWAKKPKEERKGTRLGQKHSPETIEKMRIAAKNRKSCKLDKPPEPPQNPQTQS